jgi:hypothetical protein
MGRIATKKLLLVCVAGFAAFLFASVAWNGFISYAQPIFQDGGIGQTGPGPLSASCTVNTPGVPSGGTATFNAGASGGSGSYEYKWSYPAGLAACPNADSSSNNFDPNYPNCTTVPLTQGLAAGSFAVTVKDSSGATVQSSCPAVTIAPPQQPVRFSFGHVNQWGNIVDGSGDFSVVRTGTGFYTITFKSGVFSAPPAISVNSNDGRFASIVNSITYANGVATAIVGFGTDGDYYGRDVGFSFIAVGKTNNPRSDLAFAFGGFDSNGARTKIGSNNWTSSHLSNGVYSVWFNSGTFSQTPTLVANTLHISCVGNVINGTFGAEIISQHDSCRYATDAPVNFIAVGVSSNPSSGLRVAEGWFYSDGSGLTSSNSTGDLTVSGSVNSFSVSFFPGIFNSADTTVVIGSPYTTRSPVFCAGYTNVTTLGASLNIGGTFPPGGDKWVCTYASNYPGTGATLIAIGKGAVALPPATTAPVLSASFENTTGQGPETTTSTTMMAGMSGGGKNIDFYVRNIGPVGSSLSWRCSIDWANATFNGQPLTDAQKSQLAATNKCNTDGSILSGGAPQF